MEGGCCGARMARARVGVLQGQRVAIGCVGVGVARDAQADRQGAQVGGGQTSSAGDGGWLGHLIPRLRLNLGDDLWTVTALLLHLHLGLHLGHLTLEHFKWRWQGGAGVVGARWARGLVLDLVWPEGWLSLPLDLLRLDGGGWGVGEHA